MVLSQVRVRGALLSNAAEEGIAVLGCFLGGSGLPSINGGRNLPRMRKQRDRTCLFCSQTGARESEQYRSIPRGSWGKDQSTPGCTARTPVTHHSHVSASQPSGTGPARSPDAAGGAAPVSPFRPSGRCWGAARTCKSTRSHNSQVTWSSPQRVGCLSRHARPPEQARQHGFFWLFGFAKKNAGEEGPEVLSRVNYLI